MIGRFPTAAMLGLLACGAPHSTAPVPTAVRASVSLRPSLRVGDTFLYRVELKLQVTSIIAGTTHRSSGTLTFDDRVEVAGPAQIVDRFSAVVADGDAEAGGALKRIASVLPSAAVTTRFDSSWHVASQTIDGTRDDAARTMIMSLSPIVSFRLIPRHPVAVGETWENQWDEPLRGGPVTPTRNVSETVRYQLRGVEACGPRTCATVVGDGRDEIPPQGGTSGGRSVFHGVEQVDITDAIPIAKQVESTTTVRGEQQGQPFEYTTTTTADIERTSE